tara:strand:- start:538 stop:639 length:102 start_codon:yes stop_codon:yes gene_type:complete
MNLDTLVKYLIWIVFFAIAVIAISFLFRRAGVL